MKPRLSQVLLLRVDEELFRYTHETLREISSANVEAMAIWAGRLVEDDTAEVLAVNVPPQRPLRTEAGLAVIIDADALHQVNVWLYQEKLGLIAQIHTHPAAAYHSDLDDSIPVVATRGGFSLVIPDFARGPANIETYASYRLGPTDTWDPIDDAIRDVIQVVPSAGKE
jgi:hypothetical protein